MSNPHESTAAALPFAFASICLSIGLLSAGGSARAAGPVPTQALPADGGDLGKAWLEFGAALKAEDKSRVAPYLAASFDIGKKEGSWFGMFADAADEKPVGGKRQGDRATLFVSSRHDADSADYRHLGATWSGDRWRFDAPYRYGSSFDRSSAIDCTEHPTLFPCAAKSAPDAVVSGSYVSLAPGGLAGKADPPALLIDGVAARLLGDADDTPKGTRVLLSPYAINPAALAWSSDPDHVKGWLGWPVLVLDIAPDGKSAKLEVHDTRSNPTADIRSGLTLEANDATRVRGRLKAGLPKIGAVDVFFDVPTAARCHGQAYQCGATLESEQPKAK